MPMVSLQKDAVRGYLADGLRTHTKLLAAFGDADQILRSAIGRPPYDSSSTETRIGVPEMPCLAVWRDEMNFEKARGNRWGNTSAWGLAYLFRLPAGDVAGRHPLEWANDAAFAVWRALGDLLLADSVDATTTRAEFLEAAALDGMELGDAEMLHLEKANVYGFTGSVLVTESRPPWYVADNPALVSIYAKYYRDGITRDVSGNPIETPYLEGNHTP